MEIKAACGGRRARARGGETSRSRLARPPSGPVTTASSLLRYGLFAPSGELRRRQWQCDPRAPRGCSPHAAPVAPPPRPVRSPLPLPLPLANSAAERRALSRLPAPETNDTRAVKSMPLIRTSLCLNDETNVTLLYHEKLPCSY
ncbi:uncharacterized protein LOC125227007 [Leguminivora glycinivorella]|uniref:uncharacterized protein LOC125227007 n=1 Tax=Leguminivora glycinivorella TaxID=1035111 RepID=UPI00200E670E|nr:uncharacterized protein LOC125227007 [Leguminivora glycinivorella]